ncbi:fibrinogen-like protein 1 isoform X2 [Drosophila hydei]|uniref:Fibrinogen-like protein 1 isoform X2 n=1 Tax=Drosophila hydei TaxID=7224 RepID=A0A6J1M9J7_DROHY|nr:fibrinogen-like protein 1 isoform X2 [Drosophila hydei]
MAKFLVLIISLTFYCPIPLESVIIWNNYQRIFPHLNETSCTKNKENMKNVVLQYLNTTNKIAQQRGSLITQSIEHVRRLKDELTKSKLINQQLIAEQQTKNIDLERSMREAFAEKDAQIRNLTTKARVTQAELEQTKTEKKNLEDNLKRLRIQTKNSDDKIILLESKLRTFEQNITEHQENLKICKQNISETVNRSALNEERVKLDTKVDKVKNNCTHPGHLNVISLPNQETFQVPCTVVGSNNQVWIIVERRLDHKISFNRRWEEYAQGFGNFSTEFFIGLQKLHLMTSSQPHELLIRLDNGQRIKSASYSHFRIGNETEGYALKSLGKYAGDAGDGLGESLNQKFSTFDVDNDLIDGVNCAKDSNGGWWETGCSKSSNLVLWNNFLDSVHSVEMLIRPANSDHN